MTLADELDHIARETATEIALPPKTAHVYYETIRSALDAAVKECARFLESKDQLTGWHGAAAALRYAIRPAEDAKIDAAIRPAEGGKEKP